MTSGQNYASMPVTEIADKRPLSHPSTPQRDGVLRGDVKQCTHTSPFVEFSVGATDDVLPTLQNFPVDSPESASILKIAYQIASSSAEVLRRLGIKAAGILQRT